MIFGLYSQGSCIYVACQAEDRGFDPRRSRCASDIYLLTYGGIGGAKEAAQRLPPLRAAFFLSPIVWLLKIR